MVSTLDGKMKRLSPARRKKIEARAADLITEEMSLRDLRRALRLTQDRIAETLGIGQEGVSRLEKRSDLLISTLRSYIEAMGGRLSLVAEFPKRQPVILSRLANMDMELSPVGREDAPTAQPRGSLLYDQAPGARRQPAAIDVLSHVRGHRHRRLPR